MKQFKWNDNKVIDFVNWYIKLHKLPFKYALENQSIIDSFKRGDDMGVWHGALGKQPKNIWLNAIVNSKGGKIVRGSVVAVNDELKVLLIHPKGDILNSPLSYKMDEVILLEIRGGNIQTTGDDVTVTGGCFICGKRMKGKPKAYVHLLISGNITSQEDDIGSQGLFPIGPECMKKLPKEFIFKSQLGA